MNNGAVLSNIHRCFETVPGSSRLTAGETPWFHPLSLVLSVWTYFRRFIGFFRIVSSEARCSDLLQRVLEADLPPPIRRRRMQIPKIKTEITRYPESGSENSQECSLSNTRSSPYSKQNHTRTNGTTFLKVIPTIKITPF